MQFHFYFEDDKRLKKKRGKETIERHSEDHLLQDFKSFFFFLIYLTYSQSITRNI